MQRLWVLHQPQNDHVPTSWQALPQNLLRDSAGKTMTPQEPLQGHVVGEIHAPYLTETDLYDSDAQEGRGVIAWGMAGILMGLIIVILVVVMM